MQRVVKCKENLSLNVKGDYERDKYVYVCMYRTEQKNTMVID